MKKYTTSLFSLLGGAALLGMTSCEVKKTEEGSLPEVKVEGETKLPEYDVQAPEIETGTTEIEVPTIEITPASELPDDEVDPIVPEPDFDPVVPEPDFDPIVPEPEADLIVPEPEVDFEEDATDIDQ